MGWESLSRLPISPYLLRTCAIGAALVLALSVLVLLLVPRRHPRSGRGRWLTRAALWTTGALAAAVTAAAVSTLLLERRRPTEQPAPPVLERQGPEAEPETPVDTCPEAEFVPESRGGAELLPRKCDGARALRCRRSCAAGDGEACLRLALSASSPPEALELARQACDLGRGPGCVLLTGDDGAAAAPLWARSCRLGFAFGCWRAADLYEAGRGVRRSPDCREAFLRHACRLGDQEACLLAPWCREGPPGGPPDDPATASVDRFLAATNPGRARQEVELRSWVRFELLAQRADDPARIAALDLDAGFLDEEHGADRDTHPARIDLEADQRFRGTWSRRSGCQAVPGAEADRAELFRALDQEWSGPALAAARALRAAIAGATLVVGECPCRFDRVFAVDPTTHSIVAAAERRPPALAPQDQTTP